VHGFLCCLAYHIILFLAKHRAWAFLILISNGRDQACAKKMGVILINEYNQMGS
jgi:hypothetical protein